MLEGITKYAADIVSAQNFGIIMFFFVLLLGMLIHGTGHTIERNTIALNLWPGTYDGRNEVKNVFYEASFEMVGARDITFHDNIVRRLTYLLVLHVNSCSVRAQFSLVRIRVLI